MGDYDTCTLHALSLTSVLLLGFVIGLAVSHLVWA